MAFSNRTLQRRNSRVELNLPLVDPLAGRYARCSGETFEDLRQVGRLGLIRAAERYRSAEAIPFPAFARPHIRGAILHYLRDTAPMIRAPRRLQERLQALQRCERRVDACLGRPATPLELSQLTGLSLRELEQLRQEARRLRRESRSTDDLSMQIPAQDCLDPLEDEGAEPLLALQRLEPKRRRVLQLVVLRGRSLREVAAELGISAATAHRWLHRGLAELRSRLTPASDAPAC